MGGGGMGAGGAMLGAGAGLLGGAMLMNAVCLSLRSEVLRVKMLMKFV